MSLIDPTQSALEAAMRGSMQRQALLTNNLANANTPGYQRQDINFQGALSSAMASGQSPDSVTFTPYTQNQVLSADGNGVSAEQESANLSKNGLLYENLTEIASAREQILLTAMGMRG